MTPTPAPEQALEERVADLERRLRAVESAFVPLRARSRPVPAQSSPRPAKTEARPSVAAPAATAAPPPATVTAAPPPAVEDDPRGGRLSPASLGDLIGGRVLAWLGGVATLLGLGLFLTLAIARGWIGIEARVLGAGVASGALMAAGVWLHSRRGRTEASVVLVGVSTAGLFATLVVASHVYGLISPLLAVLGSILVGAVATSLAVRWGGQAIAALGLLGALVSPLLVGASVDGPTVAVLAVAATCATCVTVRQRWYWLSLAAVTICAPQWGQFVLDRHAALEPLAALAWFGLLGLAGAMAMRDGPSDETLQVSAGLLVALNALALALFGTSALRGTVDGRGPELWLAALAALHAAAGLVRFGRFNFPTATRRLVQVLALILADLAFALSASALVLVIGWAAAAVAFAALSRRRLDRPSDRMLVHCGLGAHVTLTLVRAVISAPPASLGSGGSALVALLSIATLTACCLTCAQLTDARARQLAVGLNAVGLAALAYLTAQALSGPGLVATWALEAVALTRLATHRAQAQARWGAAAFFALAAMHALIVEAPPSSLVTGAPSIWDAAIALGALGLAAVAASPSYQPQRRKWVLGGAVVTLLYLGSVAIISSFQPGAGGAGQAVLDLSVRQQGQVLLSACWSILGLTGLIFGLCRNLPHVRNAALVLLLVTVAKVFLYDLSTLTSIYRVISFVALGLLLLAGAFAHQRLRPPSPPDLRSVHPSQR